MSRIILLCLLLNTLLTNNIVGQNNNSKNKTRWGVKAGYNYIVTSNVQSVGGSNTSGFHAGIFASGEEDNIKASGDLLFSKQGYKYKNGRVDLNYLTTTEMADFFITEDAFKLQIGLHIGYLLSAKADSSGFVSDPSNNKTIDLFNRFVFGIAGGAEFISESGLIFGMRYTVGINDINKKQGSNIPAFIPSSTRNSLKNNLLQLYAGFRF